MAFERVMEAQHIEDDDEVGEAITQVTSAMNDLTRRRGFSPYQMVFGRSPVLPANLLEADPLDDLATHSQELSGLVMVRRALALRSEARQQVV